MSVCLGQIYSNGVLLRQLCQFVHLCFWLEEMIPVSQTEAVPAKTQLCQKGPHPHKVLFSTTQITLFTSSTFPLIIEPVWRREDMKNNCTKKVWDFLSVRTEEQTAWGSWWGHVRSTASEILHRRLIKYAGTIEAKLNLAYSLDGWPGSVF